MSLVNENPLPILTGKTIATSEAGVDGAGYGFVLLTFTDGTSFRVEEISQTGEIEWRISPNWYLAENYRKVQGGVA